VALQPVKRVDQLHKAQLLGVWGPHKAPQNRKNYLKLEPKKIQKSDEKLRTKLTHILLTKQHNA
jgi:hypothetical protein